IQLSPKKTWEGFIGALIFTLIFSFFFSRFLANYSFMICSFEEYSVSMDCRRDALFSLQPYPLNPALSGLFKHLGFPNMRELNLMPIQLHALIMATFASLLAPFGGFLASGFKRAFKIKVINLTKDFSASIPGH